jgi:hypothetical protein
MKTLPLRPSRAALSLSNGSPARLLPAILAALLALAAVPAFADGPGSVGRYRRTPTKTLAPTALANLEAAQRALQTALSQISANDSPSSPQSWNHAKSIIYYGGYFARAKEDLVPALAATAEAIAYVRAHPEANTLANGPAPKDEPKVPMLPRLTDAIYPRMDYVQAVDAVSVALDALVNNPSPDYRGPVLGDLGGHRAKLIAAIAQVGADLSNGIAYNHATRGGSTGIIPISATPAPPPDPKFGATTRTYLEAVQSGLRFVTQGTPGNQTGDNVADPTQGGFVPKVLADLKRASDNVAAALAWLDTHPEAVPLPTGPTGPEPSAVRTAKIPADAPNGPSPGRAFYGPKLNAGTLRDLNETLGWLLNQPAPDHRGPVLGDIGGFRDKIMDDLGQALTDTLAGIAFTVANDPNAKNNFSNNPPPSRPSTAASAQQPPAASPPRGTAAPAP